MLGFERGTHDEYAVNALGDRSIGLGWFAPNSRPSVRYGLGAKRSRDF
jgi:hypothetical protein